MSRTYTLSEGDLLAVVFEDDEILAIDKPPGLVVHPNNEIRDQSAIELMRKQSGIPLLTLIHRLDRETSGLLLMAKTGAVAGKWGKALQNKVLQKTYLARVHGKPRLDEGEVNQPIERRTDSLIRIRRGVVPNGDVSISKYKVVRFDLDTTLLELQPLTGRTHQLRVHCEWLGCPVVGDPLYGKADEHYLQYIEGAVTRERLQLHAWKLEGEVEGKKYRLETKLPDFL